MPARGLLTLALVAALLGAPSRALAGMPNVPRDGQPDGGSPATAADDGAPATTDDVIGTVLLVGLAGVAAVCLVGTAMLMVGRRRRPHAEPASTAMAEAAAALERRTIRRAKVRIGGDEIIAAMGLDDDAPRRTQHGRAPVGAGKEPARPRD